MEAVAQLDTHVIAWLYAGEIERIPKETRALLESHQLQVSPAVTLELQYLFEIRRVAEPAKIVVSTLANLLGLTVSDAPFEQVVATALQLAWTRDPFDRLIVAQAHTAGVCLVTADKLIRKHYAAAVWGRSKR